MNGERKKEEEGKKEEKRKIETRLEKRCVWRGRGTDVDGTEFRGGGRDRGGRRGEGQRTGREWGGGGMDSGPVMLR